MQYFMPKSIQTLIWVLLLSWCTGCGGGSSSTQAGGNNDVTDPVEEPNPADPLDTELQALIAAADLQGDAAFNRTLPDVEDPLVQLGKKLFFSKSLGGNFDVACVSCHHPALGGADGLSLPVGVDAQNPNLLGPGRAHSVNGLPNVPRNSPTVLNIGLWDAGLFWDSRVESFGKEAFANGAVSDIRTPDTSLGNADPDAGPNLVTAQARFPVTSTEEMRGETFEAGNDNQAVRTHLAQRIGGYGAGVGELATNEWLAEFQTAFASAESAETLITFNNIVHALAEYQRSMVFTDNPFAAYVQGDTSALTDAQKRGAILFFTSAEDDGGNCAACHAGDRFTDELHHTIAMPQFGHGKGDGSSDDFGRGRETGLDEDRYSFRTPSLLNVAVTAPYGHAGAYASLDQVLDHYNNPQNTVEDFFDDGHACTLAQFADLPNCGLLYPDAASNSEIALDKLAAERNAGTSRFENVNLNNNERNDIVAFLHSLTDPCVEDRTCLTPWIADPADNGPDNQQLNAIDAEGNLL